MHTSGLVLEIYDDVGGEQLKSFFPSQDFVPDFVKQAHVLDESTRTSLPDDVFALVLVNGDETLRKFACIDEGNTALSVLYFIKNAGKLPLEARRQTAENLKVACGWYDLAVPEELEKEARAIDKILSAPVNMAMKNPLAALALPSVVKGTGSAIHENLARVNQAQAMGDSGLAGLTGKFAAAASKLAEIRGTVLAPVSAQTQVSPSATLTQTIKKTSSVGRLVPKHRGEKSIEPDVAAPIPGKTPERAPQHMNPVVVMTGHEMLREPNEKKASHYALASQEKYPIDSYQQVKQASAYFDEYGRQFSPSDRHEYCVNLVKRAGELLTNVSDDVRLHGSEKYASPNELQMAIDMRRQLLITDADRSAIPLLDKIASSVATSTPEKYASDLASFDFLTGLHHHYATNTGAVLDPYLSTFGFSKQASEEEAEWSDTVGNLHITGRELHAFALSRWMSTKKIFGLEFAEEFHKDPIAQYKALPIDQKKLLIRLAEENAPV